jgi:exopolysaccharide biosynthesis protein
MRRFFSIGLVLCAAAVAHGASSSVTPWVPIFQGIEQATGTNNATTTVALAVNALRIDLQDPDIRLMLTPPLTNNYVANQRETLMRTPSEFLVEHDLQVAINAVYFDPSGYNNPSGTPAWLTGVAISEGRVVSEQAGTVDSESAMLFTTNNQASFVSLNSPPASTEGIFTAFSGLYPLVTDGVNISFAYTNRGGTLHMRQPRTAYGLSQDGRYLILLTIDGRQNDFSDGALDWETAEFLMLFGAWNGMNMDGGGSTCMVKASYCGDPIDINQNSFQFAVGRPGSQRPTGCNFGVRARPLSGGPIRDLIAEPGVTGALITWQTEAPASTQVEYGLTENYGNTTVLDSRLTRTHVANLNGLQTGSNYYYRAISHTGSEEYSLACRVRPVPAAAVQTLEFDVTKSWKYTTNNLDGVNWKAPGYDDSAWLGPGTGLLHVENNALVSPKNTELPPGYISQTSPLPRTYYFRTHFQFTGSSSGLSLIFSNYVDDGAVFYLNGAEIRRLRMLASPAVITNLTPASATPPCGGGGDATCPDVFTISGILLNNLVQGDNVLAVEVHNAGATSVADLVFGCALLLSRPTAVSPKLNIFAEDNIATLYWNGQGFALQQLGALSSSNAWMDFSGPASNSPVTVPASGTMFYRLRQ